jgi:xylulose-5-phosphate/fructose-6-phosphate phosphoketolase
VACTYSIAELAAHVDGVATALLRSEFSDLKIRFINVVDLLRLQPDTVHPHGLSDRDFDSLFTLDKPVIFHSHAYPWMIHRLAYRRRNHNNLHVSGYNERGNINTPFELAIRNQIDRFTIAIAAIDRVPRIRVLGAHAKDKFRNEQIACCNYAFENGIDKPEIVEWKWPY